VYVILIAVTESVLAHRQEVLIQSSGSIQHNFCKYYLAVEYCCARLMKQIVPDLSMTPGTRAILIGTRASNNKASNCYARYHQAQDSS
jgi:hypothetical protein